jgi:hypothetical protein
MDRLFAEKETETETEKGKRPNIPALCLFYEAVLGYPALSRKGFFT